MSVEHTTAAIFLGESGSEMFEDYERVAARLVADGGPFRHETWNPGNAQAHVLSSFLGTQLLLPVTDGRLDLGTWQRVIFLELDGPTATLHRRRGPGHAAAGLRRISEAAAPS